MRSLKRFCATHNLHATSRCSDRVLDVLVAYGAGIVSTSLMLLCCNLILAVHVLGRPYLWP